MECGGLPEGFLAAVLMRQEISPVVRKQSAMIVETEAKMPPAQAALLVLMAAARCGTLQAAALGKTGHRVNTGG